MEETKPKIPTVAVQTHADLEIEPIGARIHVELAGQKVLRSTAAIKQAEAVRALVDALANAGISDDDIGVTDVSVSVDKGLVSRSSQASYRLTIGVSDTSQIAAVLDALAEQQSATLERLEWRYDETEARTELIERCGARARELADRAAKGLGQTIVRVIEFRESGMQG
ncbi:MAG: SIMPL domain-containing protein, partial [Myxococcota bacterium]